MKKILFVLYTVLFVFSMCSTQDAAAQSVPNDAVNAAEGLSNDTATASVQENTITFAGKVNFVSSGNMMSGAMAQINVADEIGQETIFVITSDTVIIGKDGAPITVSWISQGNKVTLEYIIDTHCVKIARSIKVLSDWYKK